MPPKYPVEISPVREVTLVGSADLSFWTDRLRAEKLRLADHDGQAQLYISAVASRFKGIPFCEVSISICAYPDSIDTTEEGIFLAHAFNSVRFFAWCERTFLSTPYYHAAIAVDPGPPASFEVTQRTGSLLRAAMTATPNADRRSPIHSGYECWEPTIFLPMRNSRPNAPAKQFFARLGGDTQVYSFLSDRDQITIQLSAAAPILQSLIDSRFTGRQWMIRQNGTHARSKTVTRPQQE
jgi:hypothetical protein